MENLSDRDLRYLNRGKRALELERERLRRDIVSQRDQYAQAIRDDKDGYGQIEPLIGKSHQSILFKTNGNIETSLREENSFSTSLKRKKKR